MKLRILRQTIQVPAPEYGERFSKQVIKDTLQYLPRVWIGNDQFDADEWIDVPVVLAEEEE